MASSVFMKVLESAPTRYDRGIVLLTLGKIRTLQQEIVGRYINPGDHVLDIGCGTGTFAIACAEKGASVVGIDVSPQMLAVAKRKIEKRGLTAKVQLREMSAIEMDTAFADRSFDKVVSVLVFSEFYRDERSYVLREACRVLKTGGLMLIADEVQAGSLWKRVVHSIIRIPLAVVTFMLTQTSTRTLEGVREYLADAGFEIIYEKRVLLDSLALLVGRKR